MSRKSNLQHEFLKELKKETKFGEKKHEAKQMARTEAEKNNEKYKQVKGIYSYKTYKDYSKSLKSFTLYLSKVFLFQFCKNDVCVDSFSSV